MKQAAILVAAALTAGAPVAARPALAQETVLGQILDDVPCARDPLQHYALYVPSYYTSERRWPVIFGFDAGGRGRRAVERYQAAAEKYGYIIAGSNNSKNGPWEISLDAAKAMAADVERRLSIDPRRRYTAGMSGGARVAMMLALNPDLITGSRGGPGVAGVLASSAGFPDPSGDFRESVPFVVYGTAGTDDFNHLEMRQLDEGLKSPHRLEVFEGTHEWLPVEFATEGVEWMEIRAMKSAIRPRDEKLIDGLFARRMARADAQTTSLDRMRELKSIADDFAGFKDVTKVKANAAALEREADVKAAIAAERDEDRREDQTATEVFRLRNQMADTGNATPLVDRVKALVVQAKADRDSADRRIARRVLAELGASSRGLNNPDLQKLLEQVRQAPRP
jgi:hypothetical protein